MAADDPTVAQDTAPSTARLARDGFWDNNVALVQLLGLCPLLAVTGSVVNALGLGLATLGVLVGSNIAVSLVRRHVSPDVRLPAFVMIIASFTTCVTLLMQALAFELYQVVALFVQIIVTNCAILGRAEAFASRQPVLPAAVDGVMMGLGFAAVLLVLGILREALGQGTLFAGMDLLLGPVAADWTIRVLPGEGGFLLMALPPGAFFAMGLLIALHRHIDSRMAARRAARSAPVVAGSKRVRTTGEVA